MMLFCNHGTKKCVPSLTTLSLTPDRRSKITARLPPLTSYIEAWARETPMARGTAYLETALRALAMVRCSEWKRLRSMIAMEIYEATLVKNIVKCSR